MKTIVVYKSKTGITKRYAQWIAEELKCDISDYDNFSLTLIDMYDLVIFGSRVHAGKVDGLKQMKSILINSTKMIVFATGGTPSAAEDTVNAIWKSSLSEVEMSKIPHFYMQGGLNYEKMGATDRIIMKTLARVLNSKKGKSSEEIGCEQVIGSSYDLSSRECIIPLIQYVQTRKLMIT